jgi:hypothetical protein
MRIDMSGGRELRRTDCGAEHVVHTTPTKVTQEPHQSRFHLAQSNIVAEA